MEANPGTYEHDRFMGYREAGINRLSLGVQSFQDTQLKALGRVHNANEALQAIESLATTGFDNFNIDLMHGLPGQTTADALSDLEQAIALGPTHISWYQLTIETETRCSIQSHPSCLPMNNFGLYRKQGWEKLEQSGFSQYEISAYSRPGRQAKHNLNYWQFGDYLGIGAGAHGKVNSPGYRQNPQELENPNAQ